MLNTDTLEVVEIVGTGRSREAAGDCPLRLQKLGLLEKNLPVRKVRIVIALLLEIVRVLPRVQVQ